MQDASHTKRDDLSLDLASADLDSPHAHRQFEAPRAGAAGIEVEHAGARLLLGNVAVARDHHMETGRFGFEVERREIVQHVDGEAIHFEHFRLRKLARPSAGVDVATHRGDGRNSCERLQNFRRTDIARVNDALRTAQRRKRFRPKQSVSIGNDADEDGSSRF
jgi:hypothetical protein